MGRRGPIRAVLLGSSELSPRAERMSSDTVKACMNGVVQHLSWCSETDSPPAPVRRLVARFVDTRRPG